MSDKKLWLDFLSGSDEAFRLIYDSHVQHLFKYGCHFTNDEELIKDCMHDMFIDLHYYRSNLGTIDNIKGYLLVSLKRKIINKLDQRKKIKTISLEDIPFDFIFTGENDFDNEIENDRANHLKKTMQELTPRQREAIFLRYISGLDYHELSNILKVNYQAARNLVYRGMEKLRENMNKNSLFLWFFLQKLTMGKKN
ncbi:sigma-70 family RNA polymerase sigma factor [Mariniphaga sediminis]|uniref:Sigma-70 family RNA polymerase sigma factor n=1 Tax=Mariniphaga sediminis TaxID=1628158 RepID=A0A399D126_9BACT|nr:sigma-70 family RNA polymerase sigma factor [Mariniphaga sediminis]RIH64432.1 sigma-70 family RNA polymerase sigma factor [Mariniphaga sediminis]